MLPANETIKSVENGFPKRFDMSIPGDDEMNAMVFSPNCRERLGSHCAANPEWLGLN
jgi:hypothetical protein